MPPRLTHCAACGASIEYNPLRFAPRAPDALMRALGDLLLWATGPNGGAVPASLAVAGHDALELADLERRAIAQCEERLAECRTLRQASLAAQMRRADRLRSLALSFNRQREAQRRAEEARAIVDAHPYMQRIRAERAA